MREISRNMVLFAKFLLSELKSLIYKDLGRAGFEPAKA